MMIDMFLPTAGIEVSLLAVLIVGLVIGCMAGFFGVGGGFLLTPMLNVLFGIPYNIAVGSGLSQMLGTSLAASIRHSELGNVDYKLAAFSMVGMLGGVEFGARLLEALKHAGEVHIWGRELSVLLLGMSLIYTALLAYVGFGMLLESIKSVRVPRAPGKGEPRDGTLARKLHNLNLPPMVSLPVSRIDSISVWIPLGLGVLTGFLCGLLGVGGGFVMMPALIYVVGCPTRVAVGTSLLGIIASVTCGTITHALKGNVDLLLVMTMVVGGTVGAQLGATLTHKVRGAKLRLLFALVTLGAMVTVIGKVIVSVLFV